MHEGGVGGFGGERGGCGAGEGEDCGVGSEVSDGDVSVFEVLLQRDISQTEGTVFSCGWGGCVAG